MAMKKAKAKTPARATKSAKTAKTAKVAKKAGKIAKKATARVAKKATAKVAKKARKVQPIPKGYHSITAAIVVDGGREAIEFYKKAFGAKERKGGTMTEPSGKIMHAELVIGDSIIMLNDEFPEMGARSPASLGGAAGSLLIYTRNADALFQRAVDAGAKVIMPLENAFWGDRYGQVEDPFGHRWQIATHIEDVTPREMAKRAQAAFSGGSHG